MASFGAELSVRTIEICSAQEAVTWSKLVKLIPVQSKVFAAPL